MYVDKRLAGIQAVQTPSRLNRAHAGKDTTYVVDFVNDPAEVLKAFQTYYETAELSATTDPNLVFNVRIEPVYDRLMKRYKAALAAFRVATEGDDEGAIKVAREEMNALILFKGDMGAYVRLYTFLSQIFDYGNTAIEKRAISYKRLAPLLEFGRERDAIDLSKVTLTHHALFEGELTDQDKLVYVNKVLLGKLLESETLIQQAASNSKEQFVSSPDL